VIPALAVAAVVAMCFVPPIRQDPAYHQFADHWANVWTNLPFLLAAAWGWRYARTTAHRMFLIGVALVTFGSAYYHAWPDNATLFWDRLPMTIAFMALLAMFLGERLLVPLLAIGAASVIYWRMADDLRPYFLVQFFPPLAIAVLVAMDRHRYRAAAFAGAAVFYALAKIFEAQDHQIAAILPIGGHPLKHLAAAVSVMFLLRGPIAPKRIAAAGAKL